jgi:hypothetical protein
MAYKTTINLSCANRAAALTELWSKLVAMGWTLHDYLNKADKNCAPADVNTSTETITIADHGFANGENVMYWVSTGGTVIGGLTTLTCYFVVGATTNTFQLSLTQGGAAINLSAQGVGTHYFGEGYRIYKSNGELSDRIYEYIKIDWITANKITFRAHYFWNATTHAGVGAAYPSVYSSIYTSESGFYFWIHGNKDLVLLCTKISTTYAFGGFGHIPKRFWTSCLATTANAETAGSNVVVEVNNTTNFRVACYYQIVGAAGEGRDRILVNAINAGVSLTITTLPRNYEANALIGNCPSTFGNFGSTLTAFAHTCPYNVVGTASGASYLGEVNLLYLSHIDPDYRQEVAYILQPTLWGADSEYVGYSEEYFCIAPATGLVAEDIFGVSTDGSAIDDGTSTGSNDGTTLNDTGKAWSINGWANKVVLIKAGTGSGQIRKIASNTAIQLTITEDWTTVPDATSTYAIRDEGWRIMDISFTHAMREAV